MLPSFAAWPRLVIARCTLLQSVPNAGAASLLRADASGPHFALLRSAIQSVWGAELPVVPYLMSGGTDSKHYRHLTNSTLRFCPYSQNAAKDDAHRVHGTNERLSVEDFGRALCTYRAGLRLAGAARAAEAWGDGSHASRMPGPQLVAAA
jgi:acetylornithine deacetylase/succinyl-diaminopimelate desuccinylase-like protein